MKEINVQNMPALPFDVSEALNQLRINLGFSGDQMKTIMITSSTPNEGKSFIAMNLWRMMSEVGMKTLLIDCDLRNSSLRTKYGISSGEKITGIVHYLSGKAELSDAVYQTNYPNGYLMPLSTTMANPTILLEGPKFGAMMKSFRDSYDYILVDTPPLGNVADALNIATHCDGTLLVVRSGETPRKLVKNSVEMLKRTDKPLLGMVLNRVDMNHKANSYYYSKYYRYGKYYYRDKEYGEEKRNKK